MCKAACGDDKNIVLAVARDIAWKSDDAKTAATLLTQRTGKSKLGAGAINKVKLKKPGDVINKAGGLRNIRVGRSAHRLKPHVLKSRDRLFNREAVLQTERECAAESLAHARECGAVFSNLDKYLARLAIGVHADGEIALMPANNKLVGDRAAGCR